MKANKTFKILQILGTALCLNVLSFNAMAANAPTPQNMAPKSLACMIEVPYEFEYLYINVAYIKNIAVIKTQPILTVSMAGATGKNQDYTLIYSSPDAALKAAKSLVEKINQCQ